MSAIKYIIVPVSAYGKNIVKSAMYWNFECVSETFENVFQYWISLWMLTYSSQILNMNSIGCIL